MSTDGRKLALVVDDVPVNRQLAATFFSRLGWEVGETGGGRMALEWLGRHPTVRLVLLDIGMPDLNGEAVCRQIRDTPALAKLAVVAYTAHALPVDVEHFLASGFDAVLIKPVSLQMLREVIDRLFPG